MRLHLVVGLVVASCLTGRFARADTFAQGSLIIPMDNTYQDNGALRAYGLVYSLLRQGVPVKWCIAPRKAFQGVDFTASAIDRQSDAGISNYGYRAGPFVIDSTDAAAATPIIAAWQSANPNVKVHIATGAFTSTVARYLVAAPKIAMHADGNEAIARGYLQAAGIPDSTLDPTWPNTSPDMLTPAQVVGPTSSNSRDGRLFDPSGNPAYCQLMSMHYNVGSALANPGVVAEVRQFLTHPTHFFAECQAVNAFENTPGGFFLTTTGFEVRSRPSLIDNHNFDSTFAQYDGTFGTVGGSEPAFALPDGGAYKAGGVTMITNRGFAPGTWDVWMTGYLDGACPPHAEVCGTLGKVSYLGGHSYSTNLPMSANPGSQGVRLFLNSIFDSTCALASGQPVIDVTKSVPATSTSSTVTFTVNYSNTGVSVAMGASLSDVLPSGASFVSATGGGTFANGAVTWNLGSLGMGQSGSVSVTVTLASPGRYANTATLAYSVGLSARSRASNTATVLYGPDADGDGVLDSVDICPAVANPLQSLTSDPLTCGSCTATCSAPQSTPSCTTGLCGISACAGGFSNCDGQASNGCEYANSGFASDLANCGGCGVACSPPNAAGQCSASACTIGACRPGFLDADRMAANGCEQACGAMESGSQCSDGLDNDCDGQADALDPGCQSADGGAGGGAGGGGGIAGTGGGSAGTGGGSAGTGGGSAGTGGGSAGTGGSMGGEAGGPPDAGGPDGQRVKGCGCGSGAEGSGLLTLALLFARTARRRSSHGTPRR